MVTGGAGFIGSRLVGRLLDLGFDVVAFDNLSNSSLDSLQFCSNNRHFAFMEGDVTRKDSLSFLRDGDAVVHLAAVVSVQKSLQSPGLVHDVNVGGTLNLLQASLEAGARRIVFASSAAVYGDGSPPPFIEEGVLSPISLYGATKLAGESYCMAYHKSFGLQTAILRFANVYGRRRVLGPYGSVMVRFAEAISAGKPLVIFGSGTQTRDFVHVSDVAGALASALSAASDPMVLNIGSGVSTEIGQLAGLFASSTPTGTWPIRYEKERRGDIQNSWLDVGRAKRSIGYSPKMKLREGVSDFLKWYRHLTV